MPKINSKRVGKQHQEVEPLELSTSTILMMLIGVVNLLSIGGYLAVRTGAAPGTGWLIVLPFLACITSAPLGVLFGSISGVQTYKSYRKSQNKFALKITVLAVLEVILALGMLIAMSGALSNLLGS